MTHVRITDEVDDVAGAELRDRVISYNLAATGITVGIDQTWGRAQPKTTEDTGP